MPKYVDCEVVKDKLSRTLCLYEDLPALIDSIPAADVRPVPEGGIGEMSDGYHTFNGLYYQRMILFAALVKAYKDKAWKSHRHEDGELCFGGGWFIVGIDTPEGSYTYHYDDTVWDFFDCEELPTAKHWDGHTEKDVTRLLSLDARPVVHGKWKKRRFSELAFGYECAVCHTTWDAPTNFCPNCAADMTTTAEWKKWNALNTKPITNADRVRSMTDEELAEFIGDDAMYGICPNNCQNDLDRPCKVCALDWLRQEVTDG